MRLFRHASSWVHAAIEGALVIGAFALLAVVLLAPLFSDLGGTTLDPDRPWLSGWFFAGYSKGWAAVMERDIQLLVWVYAWNWHALLTQPTAWFQANVFHPAPDALAYSEHALGKFPTTGLLMALTDNPVFAHQGDLLLTFALSGAAMYALVRHLDASRLAALLAGFVYAFSPVRLETLYHSHLLTGQYFPLALIFLDRTLVGARWRDAVAFGFLLLLHCCSSYYLAYQAFAVLPACLALAWFRRRHAPVPGLARGSVAMSLVGVAFAALALPYLRVHSAGSITSHGTVPQVLSLLSNDLWRSYVLPPWLLRADGGPRLTQGVHAYVGGLVAALAILGVVRSARLGAAAARLGGAAVAIVLVSWGLALGPLLPVGERTIPMPYELFIRWIPGFASMRMPSRFALMLMTGIAVLAGLGADVLLRAWGAPDRRLCRATLAVLFATVICVDYGLGTERYETRPFLVGRRGPRVYRELATLARGPVLELPLPDRDGPRMSAHMAHSTTHWMPMLHGTSGYVPHSESVLRTLSRTLPNARALHLLGRMTGLRYVIVHFEVLTPFARARWHDAPPGLRLVGTFESARLYEVRDPPAADLVEAVRACAGDAERCATLWALLDPRRRESR